MMKKKCLDCCYLTENRGSSIPRSLTEKERQDLLFFMEAKRVAKNEFFLHCYREKYSIYYSYLLSNSKDAQNKLNEIKNKGCSLFYFYQKLKHKSLQACVEEQKENKNTIRFRWMFIVAVLTFFLAFISAFPNSKTFVVKKIKFYGFALLACSPQSVLQPRQTIVMKKKKLPTP